jgi:hypothetical protein
MNGRDKYLSTTQGGTSQPPPPPPVSTGTPNFSPPGQGGNNLPPVVPPVVDTTSNTVTNVSTGMGADDLKVQAQQKAAAEQKQKYIDKLKAFAASMSSSPGLYGSLYGPEAEELFNPYLDPTLDRDLYNLEEGGGFSGDIPITDFQKLKFLADYGVGQGLGSFMQTDSFGNPILTSEFIRDEDGNWIQNPAGGGNIILKGLGQHLTDNWADAFDPGGARYGDDPLTTGGSAIREYLDDLTTDYFDQNWYGSDNWDDFLNQPYYGPLESLALSDPKFWKQTSLSELDPTGFADREMIYGEELGNQMATPGAWLVQPFGSEVVEGV